MANVQRRVKIRKKTLRELEDLADNASKLLVIHYSCESFYDIRDGRTARITSIAVRFFNTGQSESFSIHKTAEREKKLNSIEEHYDDLEKKMLSDFFKFVRNHISYKWLHWNMRDIGFGFQAINHRYAVLGGKPVDIPDENKFDLADKLKILFGTDYIEHPRFEKLVEKNEISKKDFLNGKEEAAAFENKEYVKLHHSTLRKVNMMHSVYEKILDRSLKNNSNWRQTYGFTPQGIFEAIKEHWVLSVLAFFVGTFLSAVISLLLNAPFQ